MTNKTPISSPSAWTEIEYSSRCTCAYLSTPIYIPEETKYFLCRPDGTRKEERLTFVVFRPEGSSADDEWEDDPIIGNMQLCVLGDDDEEVAPVSTVYLGVPPEEFISVADESEESITFRVKWKHGDVEIDKAETTDLGFTIKKDDFGEEGIACKLTPKKGEAFTIRLKIPYTGFSLTDADGNMVEGDIEISHDCVDNYSYAFISDGKNDRFSISIDDNKLNYLCVVREDGTLAVRDMRERLALVSEIGAEGKLSSLLMGAHALLVKNKSKRWRITLTGEDLGDAHELKCEPVALARFALEQFIAAGEEGEERLAEKLVMLEEKYAFQWSWLNEEDWSHEHMNGIIDMDGLDADPEKMMRQALLYNRFETFMKRLAALSLITQKPIQGDQFQARNNKRKIARCARHVLAHRRGEENIWELDEESRAEILHFFSTFHREFMAALEQL